MSGAPCTLHTRIYTKVYMHIYSYDSDSCNVHLQYVIQSDFQVTAGGLGMGKWWAAKIARRQEMGYSRDTSNTLIQPRKDGNVPEPRLEISLFAKYTLKWGRFCGNGACITLRDNDWFHVGLRCLPENPTVYLSCTTAGVGVAEQHNNQNHENKIRFD